VHSSSESSDGKGKGGKGKGGKGKGGSSSSSSDDRRLYSETLTNPLNRVRVRRELESEDLDEEVPTQNTEYDQVKTYVRDAILKFKFNN